MSNVTISIIKNAIFPDEFEEDEDELMDLASVSITTKNEEVNIKNIFSNEDLVEEVIEFSRVLEKSLMTSFGRLAEWKKKSFLFEKCKVKSCDPFHRFSKTSKNCAKCTHIKMIAREQLILIWKPRQLYELLTKYINFHFIKIFDPKIEHRYAIYNPNHPYYLAYKQMKQQNRIILNNFAIAFNFPQDLLNATFNHSFLGFKMFQSKEEVINFGYCQICQQKSNKCFGTIILYGPRHHYEHAVNTETKHFILCNLHSETFKIFHKLTHMDSNLHWKCQQKIFQSFKNISPNSEASQIIRAINRKNILEIAMPYLQLYERLNLICHERCIAKCFKHGTLPICYRKWQKMRNRMKDDILFGIVSKYVAENC